MLAAIRRPALGVVALALLIAGLISWQDSASLLASNGGLVNPGFEGGFTPVSPTLDRPDGWTVVPEPPPDSVKITTATSDDAFATYADMGIAAKFPTVIDPYKGSQALRLGTPKRLAESQNRNLNTIRSLPFVSNRDTLKFAFWLFSWEHRGYDVFQFSITDPAPSDNAVPLAVVPADPRLLGGCASSGGLLTCKYNIDVGKRGEFLGLEGWRVVEIRNIPLNSTLTFTVSAGGIKDNAHATWLYLDNVNTPPVADFSFAPGDPLEGDVVQFIDESTDLDGADDIVSWSWLIDGDQFTSQNPFFVFPDEEGPHSASLTVTDREGEFDTRIKPITVGNAAPLVSALNIEALAGQETLIAGRFMDPGWQDIHAATWTLEDASGDPVPVVGFDDDGDGTADEDPRDGSDNDGDCVGDPPAQLPGLCSVSGGVDEDGTLFEENDPLMSSGLVPAFATPSGDLSGTLTVEDGDGGVPVPPAEFTVTIIEGNPLRHEGNDAVGSAVPLAPGGVYLSYIQSAGDVDVFEVAVPAGAEVLVNLFDLPQDYDVAILEQGPEGETTGFPRLGFPRLGFPRLGFGEADASVLGFNQLGFPRLGFPRLGFPRLGFATFATSGASWADIGFPRLGFPRLGFPRLGFPRLGFPRLGEVTPTDVSVGELGLSSVAGEGIEVADFSAGRGLEDEVAWAQSAAPSTRFFVVVFGHNDAQSSVQPYSLGIEVIEQPDLVLEMGALCNGSLLVGTPQPFRLVHNYDNPATPGDEPAMTIFVTQAERFIAAYGQAAWDAMLNGDIADPNVADANPGLTDLAQHAAVQGDIISVPSHVYDNWDLNQCSIEAVNSAAGQVHDIVQRRLDSVNDDGDALLDEDPVDGLDNDADGVIDEDPIDGLNNDGDGRFAEDPADGVDNDGDGSVDEDPVSGIDNDGDAAVDEDPVDNADNDADGLTDEDPKENVVAVGSDQIVPFRRVPDETVIGNEKEYLLDAFLTPGSPLFTSLLLGQVLSDDHLADEVPDPWQGRALYFPDRPVARLVETPEQIRAAAKAFLLSDGVLQPATGFVSGYKFFTDGAQAIGDALDAGLSEPADRLINDTWTSNDLRCRLLGQGEPGCSAPDVASANAHFTHWAALAAAGFTSGDFNDILPSDEVAEAGVGAPVSQGGAPVLDGGVVFSMGCHAGFNAPDGLTSAPDAGLGIDPALDFPEAMAIQRAIYLASTGFAYGDDEGNTHGTERLTGHFAQQLLQGYVTAGDALVAAKQAYLNGLAIMTVYDEKSSIEFTLYGLPMYRIDPAVAPPAPSTLQGLQVTETGQTFNLTTVDPMATEETRTATTSHALEEVLAPDGTYLYFTADGEADTTPGRPIEPTAISVLEERGHAYLTEPPPVGGVLVTGGSFADTVRDPLNARPTYEFEVDPPEPQECLEGFWPSQMATVNSIGAQTLVAFAGQFQCTNAGPPVTGIQRLYSSLTVELLRCPALGDTEPPVISGIDLRSLDATTVEVTVDASDAGSGIGRIVVLKVGGDVLTPTDSGPLGPEDPLTVIVLDVAESDGLLVQVEDRACHVTTATGKGSGGVSRIRIDAGPDQVYSPGVPVAFKATISGFEGLTDPVSFLWDYDDGQVDSGVLGASDVTLDGSGNATFTMTHEYSTGGVERTAKLKVTDAAGGIGVDDVLLRPCADDANDLQPSETDLTPADLIGCAVDNADATATFTIRTQSAISDSFQYRIKLDAGTFITGQSGNKVRLSKEPDGVPDFHLKYDAGRWTGPVVEVVRTGNELEFTVLLSDIGLSQGDRLQWFAETQAGVKATGETGIVDNMPDTGFFGYLIR